MAIDHKIVHNFIFVHIEQAEFIGFPDVGSMVFFIEPEWV